MIADKDARAGEGGRAAESSDEEALTPAARRALAEAAERRAVGEQRRPEERNGRGGLEPVRYGDWEVKGLASDF